MKILRIASLVLALLVGAALAYMLANAMVTERPVGLQLVQAPDAGGAPLTVAVWYPTDAQPLPSTWLGLNLLSVAKDAPVLGKALPLVIVSHGNGGGPGSHADLAMALAQRGFVVAAPMHTGDNHADQSAAGTARWLVDRTRHVHATLDHLLGAWPGRDSLDPKRIGIFGFSAGGFTGLTIVGGQPDLKRVAAQCRTAPEFVCTLLAEARSPLLDAAQAPPAGAFKRDARVKAAVLAAPGLGFTFVPDGVATVEVPVQLWSGGADQNVPTATNAGPVGQALGARAQMHEIAGAGHFAFLAPCRLFGPPLLCRDAPGFDRERLHTQMNEAVAAFFLKVL